MRMRNIGGFFRTTFHILSMYLTLLSNDRLFLRRLLFGNQNTHLYWIMAKYALYHKTHSLVFIHCRSDCSLRRHHECYRCRWKGTNERTGKKKSTDKLYIIVYLTLDTTDYRKISSDNNGRSIHRPTFRWYHTQWCVLLFNRFGPLRFYAFPRKHQFCIGTMGRQRQRRSTLR